MKKLISAIIATFVVGIALPVLAADSAPVLNMNVRFMQTDNGTQAENRMMLHTVEIAASQQVENIGGSVIYRIADTTDSIKSGKNYPVEAKAFFTEGAFKVTAGLQFVPFGIYKWNNMYNPFADVPGQLGMSWDSDWGYLATYDAKPVKLDLGYWNNAGELLTMPGLLPGLKATVVGGITTAYTLTQGIARETAEKNTFTGRIGWDILSNLNLGASFMSGKVDMDANSLALTKRQQWALDATWGIVPNLTAEAEYVGASFKSGLGIENAAGINNKDNYGLLQLKYDIVKVPNPFNRISPILQYSWVNDKDRITLTNTKIKNYQEELWVKAGKNLDVFFQNVQQKQTNVATNKYYAIAVKYSFQ